jgi:hypothetical protein
MLTLEMLPADHGDCLWLEYGKPGRPRRRVLIDGGTPGTYARLKRRIEDLSPGDRRFELFIVSHIDSDHIGGAVKLLNAPPAGLVLDDVWFNGFRHLPVPADELGVAQGEELTEALTSGRFQWNRWFGGDAVVVPEDGPLPSFELEDGLRITLLSPGPTELRRMYPKWDQALEKLKREEPAEPPAPAEPDELGEGLDVAALAASPFRQDRAEPNGTSIAVLAEWEGKRILLAADAYPGVLASSIGRLTRDAEDDQLAVDAFKVAHHGSRANTSKQLLEKIRTRRYLVSTSGAVFHHPDREGIARILVHGGREKTVYFNYRSPDNEMWEDDRLQQQHRYDIHFGNLIAL